MKKALLLFSGLLMGALSLNAQQRLVLYEEFSGENCGPCAATNPGLWTLLSANTSNVLLIKYQSPIPTAGPIYEQNTADVDNRISYYSVPFAPYGRMDGAVSPGAPSGSEGHPYYLSQAALTSEAAVLSDFNISVSAPTVNAAGVLNATVTVNAVTAHTGASLKLRAALVESLHYSTPPGTNGETDFHNVVRKMYPSPDGQAIPNSWTISQSGTYTITGPVPSYVDRASNELFLVVWIQDDNNKAILQAAKSTNLPAPQIDVASTGITVPGSGDLTCGVPASIAPTVTLKNTGTNTLTSADVYYRIGGGTWNSYSWTGSLTSGATADVVLPGQPGVVGNIAIEDSVASPNGVEDINPVNNHSATSMIILSNTNGAAFPVSTDFENNPSDWVPYAEAGNAPLSKFNVSGAGYDGSSHFAAYVCYQIPQGSTGYLILPFASVPAGPKALDFYVAYAQYQGTENDKLEVVYSTDCGNSWTSVWNRAGAELATVPAQTGQFVPDANSQWKMKSVDVSAIPDGAQIAFRATSDYGNNMFIDNVNLRTGTTGIEELVANDDLQIYPNPVSDKMAVDLNMLKPAKVSFSIVNILGQQISSVEKDLNIGNNKIVLSTSALSAGVYFLNISTSEGNLQRKFVKK